jgi:hypothetical protein
MRSDSIEKTFTLSTEIDEILSFSTEPHECVSPDQTDSILADCRKSEFPLTLRPASQSLMLCRDLSDYDAFHLAVTLLSPLLSNEFAARLRNDDTHSPGTEPRNDAFRGLFFNRLTPHQVIERTPVSAYLALLIHMQT